ncbi:MAG TPA: AGE family epimerase/isomerase [Saprospiraceae bacterium]|nr:AGE family epimerase/isomerase [Saprospiraceae bacterium]HMQ84762.1 AGE family epimerase/isomerase [Saprospiraceae bacterium]
MTEYAALYREELLENVLPFWMRHSPDWEKGGFFTCLLRDGQVFDQDKFVWLQARQAWTFSMLYNQLEPRQEWLDMAKHGAKFLRQHAISPSGDWYFSLTREGKPLIEPYNIFSDCFGCMAFAQLYKATQDPADGELAKTTFEQIIARQENPKGHWNKHFPGTRPLKNFALPMILCNLCLEIEHLLAPELVIGIISHCIHEVMDVFYDAERGLILENVTPEGQFSDTFDGRLLNPGHAIEAMWFLMDLGQRLGDAALIEQAKDRSLQMLERGWDKTYGGIFYFLDVKGYPPQQLEWDQKLWWAHLESMVALAKGYQLTGDERCKTWFEQVHDYAWTHFRDPAYGEWYGYLNRRGEPLLTLKGGKWKGCFHVPRALFQCWQMLA